MSDTKRNYQKSARSFLNEFESEAATDKDDISLASDDSGGKIDEDDILSIEETRTLIYEANNRLREQATFATHLDLCEITARRTSDGLGSLLDGNNSIVATVDPLALE